MRKGVVHALGNYLASHRSKVMEIGIPKLHTGLELEPSKAYEKTIDNTCLVIFTTGFSGGFHHIVGNDTAVRIGQDTLLNLAGDH